MADTSKDKTVTWRVCITTGINPATNQDQFLLKHEEA
jgi:hypothetical protein